MERLLAVVLVVLFIGGFYLMEKRKGRGPIMDSAEKLKENAERLKRQAGELKDKLDDMKK
jgi:hypothetical protein